MAGPATMDVLTFEETLSLRQHRVFGAVLQLLLAEMNARRHFDAASLRLILVEVNRRLAFDAAIVADLLQRVNELRASVDPLLPALTMADLAAKAPTKLDVENPPIQYPTQLTIADMVTLIKERLA